MSAYKNSYIITFPKDFDANLVRIPFVYTNNPSDKVHVVKDNDRLDTIAYKYYNDSTKWHLIADANDIINPFELEIGTSLIIPRNG